MAQVEGRVEQLGQLPLGQALTDLGSLRDRRLEIRSAVERAEGRALHHTVGVLARHPFLHQRQQHPLRKHDATTAVEVGPHPLPVDGQALDDVGHQPEHVIEQGAGVRKDDALGR